MKYRKDKNTKKEEKDSGKKEKLKKSYKVMGIAKELENTLNKQNIQKEETNNTPIIQASINFENDDNENNKITFKSNKKKRALKKFEDN